MFQNWSRRTCSVASPVREVGISRYICWHKDEQSVRAAKRSHGEKTSIIYQPKHSAHMFLTRCSWSGVSAPAGTHHRSAASCRDVHISRLRPQNTPWKIGAIIFKFLPVHHFFNMNSGSSGCWRSQLFLTDVCLIYFLTSWFFFLFLLFFFLHLSFANIYIFNIRAFFNMQARIQSCFFYFRCR